MFVIKKRHVKRDSETNLITEMRLGEVVRVEGPAQFRILDLKHNGHLDRAIVSIISNKQNKITKS